MERHCGKAGERKKKWREKNCAVELREKRKIGVSHPIAASCISASRGYSSEEARCYGVGRFAKSEHHYKSGFREKRRGKEKGRQEDNEDLERGKMGNSLRGGRSQGHEGDK
ncbi:Hypothetical predicted protein [Xyrichtys novacula]|uniref:Uncharacterized protein n=1 Tax=Xyrichtys novacula TaxID=13765 RepID=A0AAV1HGE6_XYRNO|nr:Hypothetical predicted protein [Xyrichtys novacula]